MKDICKKGKPSEHCRYFSEDENGPVCLKLTDSRQQIDQEIELFLKEATYIDAELNLPIGDNCAGCSPPISLESN